eukprot:3966907-Prymnesium_polylepis.1
MTTGKSTCRRDVDTPLNHGFPMDLQAHCFMECRLMHRSASAHRTERIMDAQYAGTHTTVHTFYQLKEAPAEETG